MTNFDNIRPVSTQDVAVTVLSNGTVISTRRILSAHADGIPTPVWVVAAYRDGDDLADELDVYTDRDDAARRHVTEVASRLGVTVPA